MKLSHPEPPSKQIQASLPSLLINGLTPIISHVQFGTEITQQQLEKALVNDLVISFPVELNSLKSSDNPCNCKGSSKWEEANDELLISSALQYKLDWKRILSKLKKLTKMTLTVNQLKARYEIIKPVDNPHNSYSRAEDIKLFEKIMIYGRNWGKIASEMEGRDLFSVRNRFYYLTKKKKVLWIPESLGSDSSEKKSKPVVR